MKLFELRHSEHGVLAEGVEWTNGRAVLQIGATGITTYLSVSRILKVFLEENPGYKGTEVVYL